MTKLNDRVAGPWAYAAPGAAAAIDYLRGEPEAVRNAPVIWKTRSKFVRRVKLPDELGGFDVAYKCYANRRPRRYLLRRSPQGREAANFLRLSALGLPLVELLGAGETRTLFKLGKGYIITRYAGDFVSGAGFLAGGEDRSKVELRTAYARQVLRFLAVAHRAGFLHLGARLQNFLWRQKDGEMEILGLDFASSHFLPCRLPGFLAELDLKQFFRDLAPEAAEEQMLRDYYHSVKE
ncbi:MAG: lipopolysaccharide kinase InaA family protein [Victivallaceae bacterium]